MVSGWKYWYEDLVTRRGTLMVVHAHPDDESTSTGGILAYYSQRGVRTVVITCTNGELGDAPGGIKPGQVGHDPTAVAAIRRTELYTACSRLGVSDVELLGYHDSGMPDGDHQNKPYAFCNKPVELIVDQIAKRIDYYQPDVVVTYNPNATYQHPDHIHTAVATQYAVSLIRNPLALFLIAHGTDYYHHLDAAAVAMGIHREPPTPQVQAAREYIQQSTTTSVDVTSVTDIKRHALFAHASQQQSSLAVKISPEYWPIVFGTERFIGVPRSSTIPIPATDLFTDERFS